MPNELESRLRDLFAQLPSAAKTVEDRALASALAALPEVGPRLRRPLRAGLLAAAAAVCVLAVSAGALAAAGALHIRLGGTDTLTRARHAAVPRLVVPRGARAIAAVV